MRDARARCRLRVFLLVLGSTLVLAGAGCGGGDSSDELTGVAWQWSGVREGGEAPTGLRPILDSANYLLGLEDDGSFVGKADCRSVSGTYSLSGRELTLEVKPTTTVVCGKNSLSDEYVELLGKVVSYDVYEEGALALGLESDAGYMYFYAPSS